MPEYERHQLPASRPGHPSRHCPWGLPVEVSALGSAPMARAEGQYYRVQWWPAFWSDVSASSPVSPSACRVSG